MKKFENKTLLKRNYYAVSEDGKFTSKVTSEQIPNIKKIGTFKFTHTYDHYDHKIVLPCKIMVEEIETKKKYFELNIN